MRDDIQIVYAEKLHILIYVKFPLRKLLLPDGVLILPVIPDRIILVKDNKTKVSSRDLFSEAVQKFRDDNQLTAQELKEEKDWREMTDEEWDKMIEGVDEYIDAFKERLRQLKEIQDEAAQKAALEADSDMRATAVSSAARSATANGLGWYI